MKGPSFKAQDRLPGGKMLNISRRRFISSCTACTACMVVAPIAIVSTSCGSASVKRKMRIRVLYSLHSEVQAKPDWPNVGFDFRPAMEKINMALAKRFKDMEFIPTLATGPADAEKIIDLDKQEVIDGYIVYQMNCWNKVVQTVAGTGKPVLYADFQFGGSGGFLVYNSSFLNTNSKNVGFVASSKLDDMLAAVNCFKLVEKGGSATDFVNATKKIRTGLTPGTGKHKLLTDNLKTLSADECLNRFKNSKILAVRDQSASIAAPVFGIPLEYIPYSEVNAAWSAADQDEAESIVGRWQKAA
jgi:hypothetical protein